MKKLVLMLSVTLFSWIGWMLGERFGMTTAYLLSFIGSLVGVIIGCRVNRDYLS